VQFVPVYEIASPSDPFTQLMRIYIMLTVNIPRLAAKGPLKFNVAAEFEKALGFSLQMYIDFMFAILMHATIQRDSLHTHNEIINPLGPIWLKNTKLSLDTIHQVLSTMSFTLVSMAHTNKPHGYADFTFLRDMPYFCNQGNYYCLDYEFALGKLESGVIWRVRDNLAEPPWVMPALRHTPWVVVRRAPAPHGKLAVGVRGAAREQRWGGFIELSSGPHEEAIPVALFFGSRLSNDPGSQGTYVYRDGSHGSRLGTCWQCWV
jgi:hypothetical protein